MNRRGFLKAFGIGAAAAATGAVALLEPELWTPARTFFLPPVGGWRGNQLLTVSLITKEALRILASEMSFAHQVRVEYSDAFVSRHESGRAIELLSRQVNAWSA